MSVIQGVGSSIGETAVQSTRTSTSTSGIDFRSLLDTELKNEDVKFSAHAEERIQSRGISMTSDEIRTLSGAIDQAAQKGGRESLIVTDQAAYVVNVSDRTVITALGADSLRNNVFTQIDSAVIV